MQEESHGAVIQSTHIECGCFEITFEQVTVKGEPPLDIENILRQRVCRRVRCKSNDNFER